MLFVIQVNLPFMIFMSYTPLNTFLVSFPPLVCASEMALLWSGGKKLCRCLRSETGAIKVLPSQYTQRQHLKTSGEGGLD